jgi:hypothetical protein
MRGVVGGTCLRGVTRVSAVTCMGVLRQGRRSDGENEDREVEKAAHGDVL